MGTDGLQIDIADVLAASRLNRKTLFVGTGAQISGLTTTYGGQLAFCTLTGSGFTVEQLYQRNSGNTAWIAITVVGKQDLWWGAPAWWERLTAGSSALTKTELVTNKINIQSLDFDQTTQEFIQSQFSLPRNWDRGTIKFTPYWTFATGTGGVVWQLKAGAYSDGDALDAALGTAQTSIDTALTANQLHIGPQSAALTITGLPIDSDFLIWEIGRVPADASDTLTGDAKLLGIMIEIALDAQVAV